MKETRLIMGMPVTVHVVDKHVKQQDIEDVFDYFLSVDERFSTYKETSEISRINKKLITEKQYSPDMQEIFLLAEQTKKKTEGYFDINRNELIDPSGIVKGWAVKKASELLLQKGFENFFIDAGGDIQVVGMNDQKQAWKVGIRNPFNHDENVRVLSISDKGIATSGTAIRGDHIWNPHSLHLKAISDKPSIVSLTVVGPNVYEADRFATGAFAMGGQGIGFIEKLDGFEGYMIDKEGIATMTSGFGKYVI